MRKADNIAEEEKLFDYSENELYIDEADIWFKEYPLIQQEYSKDNFLVKDYGKTNKCYIFFSSNALYFPNTLDEFRKKIVEQDRYEWKRIASSKEIIESVGRVIFVRDIYKQFYVSGINSRVNSIDKLIELLSKLTVGYEVITVGSSAGGYIAALVAAKLSARMCFDFSGQISFYLGDYIENTPLLKNKVCNSEYKKYYDISELIKCSSCKYYYFYPKYNDLDVREYKLISKYDNVYGFAFAQKNHSATMFAGNMRFIICKEEAGMEELYCHYSNHIIHPMYFLLRTTPLYSAITILFHECKSWFKRRYGVKK